MADNDTPNTLPELLRQSNRPIIIYQGGPPILEPRAGGALGLIAWLCLFTICLVVAASCFWMVWNPNFDRNQDSVVFAEGRPFGLMRQIEERRTINDSAAGLVDYLQRLRDSHGFVGDAAAPAVLVDHDGIDDLRRQWDALCQDVRGRIYGRRIGRIDAQIAQLNQLRTQARDPDQRTSLNDQVRDLRQQRSDVLAEERQNSNPQLRCTLAAQAPACSDSSSDLWCNPQLARGEEFSGEADDEQ